VGVEKRKSLAPLGFKIQIVQPIARCYTKYAVLDLSLQTAQWLDVELPQKKGL